MIEQGFGGQMGRTPDKTTLERARATFMEWLERTGDHRLAAERAGVSERTGRRWRLKSASASVSASVSASASAFATASAFASASAIRDEATTYVGRTRALASVRALFRTGARVVTIKGPGGIGKTRLATRFADVHALDYAARSDSGGIFFCDLATAKTAEDVIAAIAAALAVTGSGSERVDQVGHAVAARGHTLLVLDNFEQVERFATETVGALVGLAPRAHFLVTSRSQLRLPGEAVWALEALDVPAAGDDDVERILSSEAVELFVDRARLVRPGWEPTGAEALVLRDLVRRLDGIPLAIELCASRTAVLPLADLLARMEKRFELLVGRTRGASARQLSLRATIDASWELLAPNERKVLAECSVFHGGFTVEAVERVSSDASAVLDVVHALVERSLVVARDDASGGRRLHLFESIRDYATERLAELDREGTTLDRHARWFAAQASQWAAAAERSPEARDRLWIELENVSAAHAHACARRDADLAASAALALSAALGPRGLFTRETEVLDAALAIDGMSSPSRARVLLARASSRRMSGKVDAALADAHAGAVLAEAAGDDALVASSALVLAAVHHAKGELAQAERACTDALAAATRAGESMLEARAHARLALLHRLRRRTDEALDHADRAFRAYSEAGAERSQADMLAVIATLQQSRERFAEARTAYERSLAILERLEEPGLLATTLANLATFEHELGDLAKARHGAERALAIFRSLGIRRQEGCVLGNIAAIYGEMARLDDARMRYDEAIGILRAAGDRIHEGIFTAQLGATLAQLDDVEGAERAFAASERILAEAGGERHDAALDAQRTFLVLAQARRAAHDGDGEKAEELREEARARIDAIAAASSAGRAAADDVRVALRMLKKDVGRAMVPAPPSSRGMRAASVRGALVIADDARDVRAPSGTVLSLAQRRAPRLILARLVEERERSPGKPLSAEDLLEAGWPGERVMAEAGASRVYVALGTLRRLGLRDVLLSRDGGYLLDPRIPIMRVDQL